MRHILRCAAVIAALLSSAGAGAAQDVTLTARDGGLAISGVLQSFDGEFYRVMTDYGLLTVDGQGVICSGPGCPDLTNLVAQIRVVGDGDAAARLLPGLIAGFGAQKGYGLTVEGSDYALTGDGDRVVIRFSFAAMGAEAAAQALRDGAAELALAALPEPDMGARVLGLDALVPVVAPGNPVGSIATADLARVLGGEVETWADLGGPDMPLVLHTLAPEAGFRRALETRIGQTLVPGVEHPSLEALAGAVARDPWAIAVTAASAVGAARRIDLTDSCGFTLAPTRLAVKAEDYPLTQPTYLLTPRRRLPLAGREFLEFLGTPAAQAVVAAAGAIDRGVEKADLIGDGLRLANAIRAAGPETGVEALQRLTAAMRGAERLSLTFRFDGGARVLDAASRDHLSDLVRLIEAGLFDGQELVLVGFSDGSGGAEANLELSRERAEVVRAALLEALGPETVPRLRLSVEAFGEALPMACDESPVGRQINRRVELWLRPLTGNPAPEN